MSLGDDIDRALLAHGMWKQRLRRAIASGSSEFSVESLRRHDACEFGKWLADPALTDTARRDARFEVVRRLHAEFHEAAADVLQLALSGNTPDALLCFEPEGEFSRRSAVLVHEVLEWRKAVGPG